LDTAAARSDCMLHQRVIILNVFQAVGALGKARWVEGAFHRSDSVDGT
jgi:hypothetical protein